LQHSSRPRPWDPQDALAFHRAEHVSAASTLRARAGVWILRAAALIDALVAKITLPPLRSLTAIDIGTFNGGLAFTQIWFVRRREEGRPEIGLRDRLLAPIAVRDAS
jgi:hypothetical protein